MLRGEGGETDLTGLRLGEPGLGPPLLGVGHREGQLGRTLTVAPATGPVSEEPVMELGGSPPQMQDTDAAGKGHGEAPGKAGWGQPGYLLVQCLVMLEQ